MTNYAEPPCRCQAHPLSHEVIAMIGVEPSSRSADARSDATFALMVEEVSDPADRCYRESLVWESLSLRSGVGGECIDASSGGW